MELEEVSPGHPVLEGAVSTAPGGDPPIASTDCLPTAPSGGDPVAQSPTPGWGIFAR